MRDMGYVMRDAGYGMRDMGFEFLLLTFDLLKFEYGSLLVHILLLMGCPTVVDTPVRLCAGLCAGVGTDGGY
jgi:hypothetical protein